MPLAPPPLAEFLSRAIAIRPGTSKMALDDLRPRPGLARALAGCGLRTVGDLVGRRGEDLTWLTGMGSYWVKQLHRCLVAAEVLQPIALPPPPPPRRYRRRPPKRQPAQAAGPPMPAGWRTPPEVRSEKLPGKLATLTGLLPHQLRRVLLEHAPPFVQIRFEPFAIRHAARSVRFDELPTSVPIRHALWRAGSVVFGDLDGKKPADFNRHPGNGNVARQIYGLMVLAGAHERPKRPLWPVPARLRGVPLRRFPMAAALRLALQQRGVKTLGQIESLTPARLGAKFGPRRLELLGSLVERMRVTRIESMPFARAVDRALERLSPLERKGLLLRFGAKGRPLGVPLLFHTLKERPAKPYEELDRWIARLRDESALPIAAALLRLDRKMGRRRSRIPDDEVDRVLGITRSKPRHKREFYLRLVPKLDRRLEVAVAWDRRTKR